MSHTTCARTWEAEATIDGRLHGDSVVAFERHASSCRDCRKEIASLARLDGLAKRAMVDEAIAPLEHRRQKLALLRRANSDLVSPTPRHGRRWPMLVAVTLVLAVAFAAYAGNGRRLLENRSDNRGDQAAEILRSAAAQWSTLAILPVLPTAPNTSAATAPASTTVASVVVSEPPGAPKAIGKIQAAGVASPAVSASSAAVESVDVGGRFVAAMEAFHDGQYAKADSLFVEFMNLAKNDARREDAAFLRAVSHARMGDRVGARSLIDSYLGAFPQGLRRSEAERLAKSLAP